MFNRSYTGHCTRAVTIFKMCVAAIAYLGPSHSFCLSFTMSSHPSVQHFVGLVREKYRSFIITIVILLLLLIIIIIHIIINNNTVIYKKSEHSLSIKLKRQHVSTHKGVH